MVTTKKKPVKSSSKRQTKKAKKPSIFNIYFYLILGACAVALAILGITNIKITPEGDIIYGSSLVVSENQIPAVIEDKGELIEIEGIPTYEEVDGGLFEDKDTGLSKVDGEYEDLGWSETYDVSSPEAFKNDTINKCIIANNRYGAQCVSLARAFWWSYADRDVSTCGTGMAKGMMNCAEENAGDDFLIYWADSKDIIQAGDWLVFDGGQYGHVGMALAPVVNGYVTLLGENQGGIPCDEGGSATNIINININKLIGFYRPKAYIEPTPTPEPEPTPTPIDKCKRWELERGDTLGRIMEYCEGEVKWGEPMNEYARLWRDEITGITVFDGWNRYPGVGLLAGHTIVKE